MPIYAATFPQDFWKHNFQQGGCPPGPLRATYASYISITVCCVLYTLCGPKLVLLAIKHYMYTVQLSSKVMFAHVSDASHTHSGRTPSDEKGVALTYVLLQLYRNVLRLHGRVSRAS